MASSSFAGHQEGQAVSRPPFFNGSNYAHWKSKMSILWTSLNLDIWAVVEYGYTPPTEIDIHGKEVPKPRDNWDASDKKMMNAQAMNVIICALSTKEYDRVVQCTTAKDMWDTLRIAHEGTNIVKNSKL
eukprot:TRINITY_DN14557_c0_g1_i1.p1 TRINITY_DN14557_c0_g1~~TRINITY_DN14557_c0_g1_i1.p1  ORF type:complete len:129 (-),score=24.27 TRINITY_DN14557_c0_g1_i1:8-394(-)